MYAFNNDPELAARVRAQVAAHTQADEITQGRYWEDGKGCFIGCIAHGSDVRVVEKLTGFPIMLTRIAESIFEGLPNDRAKLFPQQIIQTVQTGANLSLVAWKFLHWLVSDVLETHGTLEVRAGCAAALEVLAAKARSEDVTSGTARATADAAYAAAYAAADAARIRQADKFLALLAGAQ